MELERYVDDLRTRLVASVDPTDDDAQRLVSRLADAMDAAARLALLEALSDAAADITRELAPGSVDVRIRGREPEFVVTPPPATTASADPAATTIAAVVPDTARALDPLELDEPATTRTTLRLPDRLKARVERAAADEGVSLNTWLVRAVAAAVDGPGEPTPAARDDASRATGRFVGWVR